jgi:hypothetical protein
MQLRLRPFRCVHNMKQWKNPILDTTLIIIGTGCSTWFISTNGHGQKMLFVGAGMIFVSLITGMVSFVVSRWVQIVPMAVIASVIVTDLLFGLYLICLSAFKPSPHGHEALMLLPMMFVMKTAPTVMFAAIGFSRFARRFYQRKQIKASP